MAVQSVLLCVSQGGISINLDWVVCLTPARCSINLCNMQSNVLSRAVYLVLSDNVHDTSPSVW
jgi:hypothetical protein